VDGTYVASRPSPLPAFLQRELLGIGDPRCRRGDLVAACTSQRRGSGAEDVEPVFFACRRVRNRFQTRGVQTGSTWRAGKALLPPPASKDSSIPRTQVGETGRSMLGLSEIPGRFRSMAVAGEADS
jgi:hypothetical protein